MDDFVTEYACPEGDRIEIPHVPGARHLTVRAAIAPDDPAMDAGARLTGSKPVPTCGLPGHSSRHS